MSGAIRGLHNLASRVIDGVDFVAENEDSFFNHFMCGREWVSVQSHKSSTVVVFLWGYISAHSVEEYRWVQALQKQGKKGLGLFC